MRETPEHWSRVEAIVDRALDAPAEARAEIVRSECGGDAELLEAVERWLEACEAPALMPDTNAAAFAARILEDMLSGRSEIPPEVSRVGPYRLLREIGRGGMGAVFLAERDDGQFAMRVALKLMRTGTSTDPRLERRFREERQILARLEHPNIAALLDGGITDDEQPYFVMQYVEGSPIDRFCDERLLSIEERLTVFLDVCDAVQHAHERLVVHRDLKPSNVLVGADGKAKLLDFGIAKMLEVATEAEPGGLTRTGERLLTPDYASPEQIRGEPIGPASDVYALGVMLHELLTGRWPYRRTASTPHAVERAVLEEPATVPSAAVTGVPRAAASVDRERSPEEIGRARATTPERLRRRLKGDLDAIVLKALEKDPQARYATAGAMAEDVRRHLAGQPILARGRAPGYRLRRLVRRNLVPLSAGALGLAAGVVVLALAGGRGPEGFTPDPRDGTDAPVLAVGRIADHRDGHAGEHVAPLADMLATNLARTRGLDVLSAARMYELIELASDAEQPSDDSYARAARRAGATVLLDGAIYSMQDGRVRMDVRRVDLASGSIAGAESATGADLFAVADSATRRLVAELGLVPPPGSIADVTTRSLAAYDLYSEGLRRYFAGDETAAREAFDAALREDSTFAMAAYYGARSAFYIWRAPSATVAERDAFESRMALARRLAERTSDRERLMIRAWDTSNHLAPELAAVAETLVVRYPHEVEGHLAMGMSLELQGDFRDAIPYFLRVMELDSMSLRAGAAICNACEAVADVVEAYALSGSLDLAEREARRWLEIQPTSPGAHRRLADVLAAQGRHEEVTALWASARDFPLSQDTTLPLAKHWIRAGELQRADSTITLWLRSAMGPERAALLLLHGVVLRNQGRFREALAVARELRAAAGDPPMAGAAPPSALLEAQVLLELGRHAEAHALFDSIARWPAPGQPPSVQATFRVTALAMVAAARAAAGDTVRWGELADSLERDGQRAFLFRPRDQHFYARGLLLAARGEDDEAIRTLRAALAAAATDFGRVNLELARLLLGSDRPYEAVDVLRPLERGWFMESTNLHNTLTEVHEMLGQAWEAAGEPDSAAVHWRRVASDWVYADAPLRPRRDYALGRLAGG